jgi:hypothetical protein
MKIDSYRQIVEKFSESQNADSAQYRQREAGL